MLAYGERMVAGWLKGRMFSSIKSAAKRGRPSEEGRPLGSDCRGLGGHTAPLNARRQGGGRSPGGTGMPSPVRFFGTQVLRDPLCPSLCPKGGKLLGVGFPHPARDTVSLRQ